MENSSSKQGQRIVRRLVPRNRVLIFDLDQEDRIIDGKLGETIEIQYQLNSGQVEKLEVELR